MNLVVIPFHDWKKCEREGFRTRDAHFMQEFERHPAVDQLLIINRPISIAEMIVLRRNWRPRTGTSVLADGDVSLTQVGDHTYTLDIRVREFLRPLRMQRSWTPYIFSQPMVATAVESALDKLGMTGDYSLFMSAPLFAPLLIQLAPRVAAFDALDNLLKHSLYRNLPHLDDYYDVCIEHADFISANSQESANWLQVRRPDAVHISNGVDKAMFDPGRSYERPADMAALSGPVVGYAGKMQEMFDVGLMSYVAEQLPDVDFVFIGQQLNSEWMKPLWGHANVHFLGDKHYSDLPRYLASFDVCIIPYNLEWQHGGDPIKFYEYLAMGKPVVTTEIGGVGAFRDYPQVRIPNDADGFLAAVREFTVAAERGETIVVRPLPDQYTWQAKADQIIQAMIQREQQPGISHSMP